MSELGDKSAARIAFGRAIEIDPASADARNDFGVFLFRSDEIDRSIEELIEAVRLDGSRARLPREPRARLPQEEDVEGGRARARRGHAPRAQRDAASGRRSARSRAEQKRLDDAADRLRHRALPRSPRARKRRPAWPPSSPTPGKLAEAEAALDEGHRDQREVAGPLEQPRRRARRSAATTPGAIEAFQKALALDAAFERGEGEPRRARPSSRPSRRRRPRPRARGARRLLAALARSSAAHARRPCPPTPPTRARDRGLARPARGVAAPPTTAGSRSSGSSGSRRARTPSAARTDSTRRAPGARLPARLGTIGSPAATGDASTPAPGADVTRRREARPTPRRARLRRRRRTRPCSASARVLFYLIRGGDRLAVRVKDSQSEARRDFHGIDVLSDRPVLADRGALRAVRPAALDLRSRTCSGTTTPRASPGRARLRARRQDATASTPCSRGARRTTSSSSATATNGTDTYGAGRFLYVTPPVDGKTVDRLQQGLQPAVRLHRPTPPARCRRRRTSCRSASRRARRSTRH